MSILIEDGVLLDVSEQAPPPSKDYANLRVTLTEVQWRYWKINPQCLKPNVTVAPTEQISSTADFLEDSDFQSEVKRIFGLNTLEYVKNLCRKKYNFLDRLEKNLQIYILSFLEIEELGVVAQVNKHFEKLCNSDQLWEHIVENMYENVTSELKLYAEEVGWKRAFFTDKVQLRLQMRRRKKRNEERTAAQN